MRSPSLRDSARWRKGFRWVWRDHPRLADFLLLSVNQARARPGQSGSRSTYCLTGVPGRGSGGCGWRNCAEPPDDWSDEPVNAGTTTTSTQTSQKASATARTFRKPVSRAGAAGACPRSGPGKGSGGTGRFPQCPSEDGCLAPAPQAPVRAADQGKGSGGTGRFRQCPSEDGCLAPYPPYLPQRVAHLPHRHVCARGLHDRVHEVLVLGRRLAFQRCERAFDRRGVAPCP